MLGYRPTRIKTPYIAYKGNAKQEPDRIYIISKDRFVYAYDKGELKSLEAPSGRRLYFKTKGIRITGIEQRADTAVYNLLSAKYDELNRLVSLKIGPISHKFAYEGDSEMLASWKPFNIPEREVKFRYRDGLLSSIAYPNTDRENFVWTTSLRDFEAGGRHYLDNAKFKPVLMSDSENMYTFGQEKAGIVMQKANLLGNADKTIFNPRTNRLTTIDKGGVSNSVQWGRGFQNEATNKLSEVISPKGEAVVKLDYDEEGRISQMVKRGENPLNTSTTTRTESFPLQTAIILPRNTNTTPIRCVPKRLPTRSATSRISPTEATNRLSPTRMQTTPPKSTPTTN